LSLSVTADLREMVVYYRTRLIDLPGKRFLIAYSVQRIAYKPPVKPAAKY
jgi:hypothetical protein